MNLPSYPPKIGVHLRLQHDLLQVLTEAEGLHLPVFQFFAAKTINKKTYYITPTPEEKTLLREIVAKRNATIFMHACYWINAASWRDDAYTVSKNLLKKEVTIAQELEVPFIVLHPGTANGLDPETAPEKVRQLGIERLAAFLNEIVNNQPITILLENTAHGKNAIGSDLFDFHRVKALLDQPEKVHFCLDTAHAFAYGYDVTNFEEFYALFNKAIGRNNLKLIHLNDVEGSQGNKQDKHTLPGEGQLGMELLKKIVHFEDFLDIPKIVELPPSPKEIIQSVLTTLQELPQ